MGKPQTKKIDLSAIGAHMLSQEIVLACFFETLSRTQPTIALETAKAIEESRKHIDEKKFPGVQERVSMYVSMLESQAGKALQ